MNEVEQLLYTIAHDLKAPVRKVGGFATLLGRRLRGTISKEDQELLAFLMEGAEQLDHMLGELMVLTRIGHLESEHESVSLDAAMTAAAAKFSTDACPVSWDELPTLHGEPSQIELLLGHLVDNAVRYGKGPVHVRHTEGRIEVHDAGTGIKDPERALVMFRRLDSAAGPRVVGMGLPISKRIVERHGGELGFATNPACVWFKWPAPNP